MSGTKVYGASDDLIEFEGDLHGEVSCYGCGDDDEHDVLLAFSDGTVLRVHYGKGTEGIWAMTEHRRGDMLDRIDVCTEETDAGYSDVAHFLPGPLKCWAGKEAEFVQ